MEDKELLEKEMPGAEKPEMESDGETGTPENGNEAPVEAQNIESGIGGEPEGNGEMPEPKNDGTPENDGMPDPAENVNGQAENVNEEPAENVNEEPAEKMLTQSQVNELVGKARAEGRQSTMKELYGRYGVNDDNEMNDIFGRGQGYDLLNDEYNALNGKYGNLAAENALLKTQVVPGRWDDVKAILGSKGMEVNVENIQAEMATHPEWSNASGVAPVEAKPEITPDVAEAMAAKVNEGKMQPEQISQVKKLGSNIPEAKVDKEDSDAMRWFGL